MGGFEEKGSYPTTWPTPLSAVAMATSKGSRVPRLIAFPLLNSVAMAPLGLDDDPAAWPKSFRPKALLTSCPATAPRSVMIYVCTPAGTALDISATTKNPAK